MTNPKLLKKILNIGIRLEHSIDQRQSIRFINGTTWIFLVIILITSILTLPTIQVGFVALRLIIITTMLLLILYWNKKQRFRWSRMMLGYIFPVFAFVGQLMAKQSLPVSALKSFMYYVPALFIAMLVTIPLNIYHYNNSKKLYNTIVVFGLLVIQEPMNHLTGVGFVKTGEQISFYITYLGLLTTLTSVFWAMFVFKQKESNRHNEAYKTLTIKLNQLIKERTQELEKSQDFLKQLHLISINQSSPRTRIQKILTECQQFLEMDLSILSRIEKQQDYIVAQVAENQLNVHVNDHYKLSNTICEIITIKRQQYQTPFVITSTQNNSFYEHPAFRHAPIKTYIGITILIEGKLYGTFNVSGIQDNRDSFSQNEIALFRQAAQAITNEVAQEMAQDKIKQREQEFFALTQAIPVGVFRNNPQGECIFVNPKMTEVADLSFEECLGNGWTQGLHPDDAPQVYEAWTKFIQNDEPYKLHFRLRGKKQQVKWVYGQAVKQYDTKGIETGVVGSISDISEVVLSKRENERLILIAKSIDNMVIITDKDGLIEWVNESFTRHTSYSINEIIGTKPGSFLQGEETQPEKVELMRVAIQQQRPVELEIINYTKTQQKFWVEIKMQPIFNEEGLLTNFIAIEKDITERKAFIQQLSNNEERFRNYLDNAPFGVFLLSLKGQVLEVNQAACKITGYNAEELLQMNFAQIHEKQYQENLVKRILLIPQTRLHNVDYTFIKKDGQRAHWRINVGSIDKDTLLVFTENITNRLNIILKLRSNEKKFRSYVNNAPHGVFVANSQGDYLEVNRAASIITGYSRGELLKMNVLDLYAPQLKEQAKQAFSNVKELGEVHVEFPFIRKDGKKAYWSISAARIAKDKVIGFTQDITHRKQQEKQLTEMSLALEMQNNKLQLAIASGNFIAWEMDIHKRGMKFLPPNKENAFFKRSHSVYILQDFLQTVHPTQQETFARKIDEHIAGRTPFFEHDLQVKTQNEEWKWIHCHGKIIQWNASGGPVTAYGIMQDITDKKNTELLLFQGQEKERKRISREIHDSIGQMLFASRFLINKHLAKVLETNKLRQIDDLLADILKETRYIINNLGVSVFDNDDLFQAFQSLINKMQDTVSCPICFSWHGAHQVIDPSKSTHIFRIFQESLYNAIKYAQAQEITVMVDNQDYFQMCISDDGIGFQMDDIAHIEGFGLSNIRHRTKTIEGQVQVLSQPNQGTMVALWLE